MRSGSAVVSASGFTAFFGVLLRTAIFSGDEGVDDFLSELGRWTRCLTRLITLGFSALALPGPGGRAGPFELSNSPCSAVALRAFLWASLGFSSGLCVDSLAGVSGVDGSDAASNGAV